MEKVLRAFEAILRALEAILRAINDMHVVKLLALCVTVIIAIFAFFLF